MGDDGLTSRQNGFVDRTLNRAGRCAVPGYSVTVSLMGFKTAVLNNVTLNAAIPANVKVTLAVGTLEENVTVTGDSALVVQTQTPSIATNLTGTQITSLPLSSRNALDSLTSLPASTRPAPRAVQP